MSKKEKKQKVVYIDDGRTIADMSALQGEESRPAQPQYSSGSRFKDCWNTYWSATRMMFLPTLVICGGMALLYGLFYVIFTLFG